VFLDFVRLLLPPQKLGRGGSRLGPRVDIGNEIKQCKMLAGRTKQSAEEFRGIARN
jgi:hypothetical protein